MVETMESTDTEFLGCCVFNPRSWRNLSLLLQIIIPMKYRAIFLLLVGIFGYSLTQVANPKPNIVLLFLDDVGYGDLGCYGSRVNKTPEIDSLAKEGQRWTSFYSAGPWCTPSRYGMMTGCHPVVAKENYSLRNSKKVTLPSMLRKQGYATALIGKWHLGDLKDPLNGKGQPLDHGFDYYYGTPASNDIPRPLDGRVQNYEVFSTCDKFTFPTPLTRNREIIEMPANQELFTKRYTEESIRFIQQNQDRPFFLYVAHNMAHAPVFASKEFQGKSIGGRYGDTVEELDWSVGQIMKTLRRLQLEDNTMVIVTSDNGPWSVFRDHAGTAFPLRGEKHSWFEGGQRVPTIVYWKGKIKPATIKGIGSNMDFYGTFAALAEGSDPKNDPTYSSLDLAPALFEEKPSPRTSFLFMDAAYRSGDFKIHRRTRPFPDPRLTDVPRPKELKHDPPLLYDLDVDRGEQTNIARKHPGIVARLNQEMDSLLGN
jgi:arylsulfatase A